MPEIIETTVYRLDELAQPAKDKARLWYREVAMPEDWYEFVYEDFETIAAMLGVELKTQTVRLYGGQTRQKPCIFFTGFWSQGDGACFEARYRYRPDAKKAVYQHAPRTVSCSTSRIRFRPSKGAISSELPPTSRIGAIITTSTRWTSRFTVTARSR